MIRINNSDYESQLHTQPELTHGQYKSHIADNRKFYEISRSTDFEFIIEGEDLGGLAPIYSNIPFGAGAQESLRLSVEKCPIPHFSIDVITQRRGNSVTKYAGTPSFDSGSLVIRDWIGLQCKDILMAWQHQAYDVYTDKTGLLNDYKKNGTLIEYTPDKQKIRSWTLYGCWISRISEDDFDNGGSQSERKITATIEYDKAILDPPDDAEQF